MSIKMKAYFQDDSDLFAEMYENNEYILTRRSVAPYRWCLTNKKFGLIDEDQYINDILSRHKIEIEYPDGRVYKTSFT